MDLEEINRRCPWCGGSAVEAMPFLSKSNFKLWRAKCRNCGAGGPTHDDEPSAMKAWSNRQESEPQGLRPVLPLTVVMPTIKAPVVSMNDWKSRKFIDLIGLAWRMWELNDSCYCAEGLECVACKLHAMILEIRGGIDMGPAA